MAVIDPVAFSLGPLQIHWYGIIMGTTALLGIFLAAKEADRLGLDSNKIIDMMVWVLPSAIIGARLYYVIFEWEYYALHPEDIIAVWKGGLAIHGGLIGAFIAGYLYVRKHRLPFLKYADIAAPSIILGQAIGRWGNFINQEAHGGPVSRAFLEQMYLPDWMIDQMTIYGVTYHPTFLYESMWNLFGFLVLLLIRYLGKPKEGEIFFTYLAWYSVGRFFIEGLRTDSLAFSGPEWLASFLKWIWAPMDFFFDPGVLQGGNIRVAQLVSLLLILFGIFMIIWRRLKKEGTQYYQSKENEPTTATSS